MIDKSSLISVCIQNMKETFQNLVNNDFSGRPLSICNSRLETMTLGAATSADGFWSTFTREITALQDKIVDVNESSDLVSLKDKFSELSAFATDSGLVLADYDVKRAQEVLAISQKNIKEREELVKPRKKFVFKSKHKVLKGLEEANDKEAENKGNGEVKTMEEKEEAIDPTLYIVESKNENDRIVLTAETIGEMNGVMRALHIKNCKGATIFARCVLGAVRIEHCEDCKIFLGPCSTSVYLDSITRGAIFITSHQLRIHKCVGPHLYVKVNGHPIIEDCKEMGFAPYQVTYKGFEQDLKAAQLEMARCWDNVVDFRWHRSTHSPNWRVLALTERTVFEIVKDDHGDGRTVWGRRQEEEEEEEEGRGPSALPPVVVPPLAPSAADEDEVANAANDGNKSDESDDEM